MNSILIDWIEFDAVSAIFHPFYDDCIFNRCIGYIVNQSTDLQKIRTLLMDLFSLAFCSVRKHNFNNPFHRKYQAYYQYK